MAESKKQGLLRQRQISRKDNNEQNPAINNYTVKLAKLFGQSIDKDISTRVKSNVSEAKNYGGIDSEADSTKQSLYSSFKIAPVGIDRIVLDYQISGYEKPKNLLSRKKTLFGGRLELEGQYAPFVRFRISFNATTLQDPKRHIPLSLREYYENFKIVEKAIQNELLPDFSIWRCQISSIEIFKTVQMTHAPLDYYECLNVLGLTAAYKKGGRHISESGRTFSLHNSQEELIFYDKTAELIKKLRMKKQIIRAMPERMMRVEWKFQKGKTHTKKLNAERCFDLFKKYEKIVSAYRAYIMRVLGEIKVADTPADFGTVTYFESLFRPKGGKRSKSLNRTAKDTALGRYLIESGHLDNFLRAKKGDRQQNKKINDSMRQYVGLLKNEKSVRYIDLYNELKGALLNQKEMQQPVRS